MTDAICAHIESVYQENSPEKIYFLMLYNIFNEFLEDLNEDVLPNDLTGYKNSVVWNKLFNFQKDAATGIINKLESFNGVSLPTVLVWEKLSPPWQLLSITSSAIALFWCFAQEAGG